MPAQQPAHGRANAQKRREVQIDGRFFFGKRFSYAPAGHGNNRAAGEKRDRGDRHHPDRIQNRFDNDPAAHSADGAQQAGEKGNQAADRQNHCSHSPIRQKQIENWDAFSIPRGKKEFNPKCDVQNFPTVRFAFFGKIWYSVLCRAAPARPVFGQNRESENGVRGRFPQADQKQGGYCDE